MDGELIAVEQSTAHNSLDLIKDNDVLKKENTQATLVVQQVLHNKPNPVIITNKKTGEKKRHLEYEDWIALGNAYGITVKTRAEPKEVFESKGFKGYATVIRVFDGVEIGGAEAYCLDNESKWQNRDYFQMASMAQTRAGSKALSNALRGVVALDKSLSGTPGEEMEGLNEPPEKPKAPPTQSSKSAPKQSAPKPANTSNLGYKAPKPKLDDEAIEVEATEVQDMSTDKPSKPLKELIDENAAIKSAVKELQANDETVNRDRILDKLLDLMESGTLNTTDYKKAKELLE